MMKKKKKKEKLKYEKKTDQKFCNIGVFQEFKTHTLTA